MFARIRSRLSYSNVIATMALFVALGGASYAAVNLPKNSVGSAEIEKNAVKAPEVANKAIGSGELKDGAVACADLAADAACGINTTVATTTETIAMSCSESSPVPPTVFLTCNGQATITASCGAGERVTGGGYEPQASSGPGFSGTNAVDSKPASGGVQGWSVRVTASGSNTGNAPGVPRPPDPSITVYAVCAS